MVKTNGQFNPYEGRCFKRTFTNLGEFEFQFMLNPFINYKSEGKYFMEVFCRPYNCKHTKLIDTKFIDDVDLTMAALKDKVNFNAYIEELLLYSAERVYNEEDPEICKGIICKYFSFDS